MINPENIQYPAPKQKYKVLVYCATYNQSKYIEEALKGFVMQKTNFPYVCLVMDDASTDGEQEVIKAWMESECDMSRAETIDTTTAVVVIVPHKNKEYCTFAFYLLKQNLYGTGKKSLYINPWREICEYETVCEGDDYWTDPLKLQKQVDYMEAHHECGLVWGKARCFIHEQQKFKGSVGDFASSFDDLINNNVVCTLTTLFRTKFLLGYNKLTENQKWLMGDYPLWLYIASMSKIHFLNEYFAVYRVLTNSASHCNSYEREVSFLKSVYDIKTYFLKLVHHSGSELIQNRLYYDLFVISYKYRKKREAYTFYKQISFSKLKIKAAIRCLIMNLL